MEIKKDLELLLWDKFNLKVCAIAEEIFERMEYYEEEDIEEALRQAMDDELIYDDDLWEIMKYYQRPNEANFNEAMDEFYNDLLEVLYKVNA